MYDGKVVYIVAHVSVFPELDKRILRKHGKHSTYRTYLFTNIYLVSFKQKKAFFKPLS